QTVFLPACQVSAPSAPQGQEGEREEEATAALLPVPVVHPPDDSRLYGRGGHGAIRLPHHQRRDSPLRVRAVQEAGVAAFLYPAGQGKKSDPSRSGEPIGSENVVKSLNPSDMPIDVASSLGASAKPSNPVKSVAGNFTIRFSSSMATK